MSISGVFTVSAKEKAKEGKRLLKQAVFDLVTERPGITPKEVMDELDLYSPNMKGDFKDNLFRGIESLLSREKLTETRLEENRNRLYPVGK
jgi:hypothetical protein